MLVWNYDLITSENGDSVIVPKEIKLLINWPNHNHAEANQYSSSLFACELKYKEMSFEKRKMNVYLAFAHICLVYNFEPKVVHKEFIKLAEYRDGLSDDFIREIEEAGYELEDDRGTM